MFAEAGLFKTAPPKQLGTAKGNELDLIMAFAVENAEVVLSACSISWARFGLRGSSIRDWLRRRGRSWELRS